MAYLTQIKRTTLQKADIPGTRYVFEPVLYVSSS
jgi:hypothetical protein